MCPRSISIYNFFALILFAVPVCAMQVDGLKENHVLILAPCTNQGEWSSSELYKVTKSIGYIDYTMERVGDVCNGSINKIWVAENLRRKRLGTRLLARAILHMYTQANKISVIAMPRSSENDAQKFFKSFGFVIEDTSSALVKLHFESDGSHRTYFHLLDEYTLITDK